MCRVDIGKSIDRGIRKDVSQGDYRGECKQCTVVQWVNDSGPIKGSRA